MFAFKPFLFTPFESILISACLYRLNFRIIIKSDFQISTRFRRLLLEYFLFTVRRYIYIKLLEADKETLYFALLNNRENYLPSGILTDDISDSKTNVYRVWLPSLNRLVV